MTATRIAYQTTDEVNFESAIRTARECGASLSRLPDSAARPSAAFAASLHDLDHVDSRRGRAVVDELLARPSLFPVAIHGYNLEDDEVAALHANGVIVSRTFDPELVRALCRASGRPHAGSSEPSNRDPREAADDPAVLCGMVRSLASHAHRAMRRSSVGIPDEIGELKERIGRFQHHLDRFRRQDHLRHEHLQRWLDNLLRCVDGLPAGSPEEGNEREGAAPRPERPGR